MEALLPLLAEYGLPGAIIIWLMLDNNSKGKRIEALTDRLTDQRVINAEQNAATTNTLEKILDAVLRVGT